MICVNLVDANIRNVLRARRWRERNPQTSRTYSQTWYNSHSLARLKSISAWGAANPDKRKEIIHRRRARVLGGGGSFTIEQFKKLGAFCYCCKRTEIELDSLGLMLVPDHIIPLVNGGSNDINNIQPLCHGRKQGSRGGCNQKKAVKTLDYRPLCLQ